MQGKLLMSNYGNELWQCPSWVPLLASLNYLNLHVSSTIYVSIVVDSQSKKQNLIQISKGQTLGITMLILLLPTSGITYASHFGYCTSKERSYKDTIIYALENKSNIYKNKSNASCYTASHICMWLEIQKEFYSWFIFADLRRHS